MARFNNWRVSSRDVTIIGIARKSQFVTHIARVCRLTLIALLIPLVYACNGSSNDSTTSNPVTEEETPTPSNDDSTEVQLECGSQELPCTLGEVPSEIVEQGNALALQALNAINSGASLDSQSAMLRSVEGMLTVFNDESAIRFHLSGGRPHWIVPQQFRNNAFDEAGHENIIHSRQSGNVSNKKGINQRSVVRTDEEEKRALVLAPYLWDFGAEDDAVKAFEVLGDMRGYEGNVDYIFDSTPTGDDGLTLENFENWDQYDVIHLSTHGQQICNSGKCYSELSIGLSFQDIPGVTGVVSVTSNGAITVGGQAEVEPAIEADFFRKKYGDGLENTHIALMGCETAKGRDLLDVLGTDSSVVLGWTESVSTEFALTAVSEYYTNMKDSGRISGEVFEDMVSENKHQYTDTDLGRMVTLVKTSPRNDLRIRETIRAYNPETSGITEQDRLTDGMQIPLVGAPDDGAADKMSFRVVVDGIEEGDASLYDLNIYIDGVKTPETWNLGSATKLGEYNYELSGEAELGFDNQVDADPYEVEFKVDLPTSETGTTFQILELVPFASWSLNISGPQYGGVYTGSYAIIGSSSTTTQMVLDTTEPTIPAQGSISQTVGTSIQVSTPLDELPLETPIALDNMRMSFSELGNDGFYDVMLQIGGSNDAKPVLLVVGEQPSLLELPPIEEFIPPPAPELVLTSVDRNANVADGTISGALWTCFFDTVPHFCDTYPFTLAFKARFP